MRKRNKNNFENRLTLSKIYGIIKYIKNKKGQVKELAKVETMENLKAFVESVKEKNFTVNGVKIKQTERNELKADFVTALQNDLAEIGLVVGRSKEGVIVGVENDNEGVIYGVLDTVFKNLDYIPELDIEEYQATLEERAERERKRAEKRAKAKG